ncbi:hypothetical protein GQ600_21343 [Phytophthora cactorum]|nr:hypothetical protein GQ600_21343 [Phytophthora cactorum]
MQFRRLTPAGDSDFYNHCIHLASLCLLLVSGHHDEGSSVVGWCRLSVGYRERRPKVRTGNAERTTAAAPAYTTLARISSRDRR